MKISLELIKELRAITCASVLECKKALEEVSGDIQKAVATIAKKKSKGERMTEKEVDALEQLVQIGQEMIKAERAVI